MTCEKTFQITYGATNEIVATYDFSYIKIAVEMNVKLADRDRLTALELEQMPIKSAIAHLQDLLSATGAPSP